MEEKVRYMESKVMVSILYIGFNCMFVFVKFLCTFSRQA